MNNVKPIGIGNHKMVVIKQSDEEAEVRCNNCGRHIKFNFLTTDFEVLEKGAVMISHPFFVSNVNLSPLKLVT